jgi:hypothetical protein
LEALDTLLQLGVLISHIHLNQVIHIVWSTKWCVDGKKNRVNFFFNMKFYDTCAN